MNVELPKKKKKKCCRIFSLLHHYEAEIPWHGELIKARGAALSPQSALRCPQGCAELSGSPCCRWESPFGRSRRWGDLILQWVRAGVLSESAAAALAPRRQCSALLGSRQWSSFSVALSCFTALISHNIPQPRG